MCGTEFCVFFLSPIVFFFYLYVSCLSLFFAPSTSFGFSASPSKIPLFAIALETWTWGELGWAGVDSGFHLKRTDFLAAFSSPAS